MRKPKWDFKKIWKVSSSNLDFVFYDEPRKQLYIRFLSQRVTYKFFAVPRRIVVKLLGAPSHGKYFCARIRNDYRYKRL